MRRLIVIAGASICPAYESLGRQQFARSAEFVSEMLRPVLALSGDFCSLFDDARTADDLDRQLGSWLEERARAAHPAGAPTDVLFYYVGHGLKKDGGLYLTVRATRADNPAPSSWSCAALANTLRTHAKGMRKHVVLDCCHAAAALSAFQIPDPLGGSALLCAAASYDTASSPNDELLTSFSQAFVTVVTHGLPDAGERVSLRQLHTAIRAVLEARGAPTPSLDDPEQKKELVSDVPILPNGAKPGLGDTASTRWELYYRLLELEQNLGRVLVAQVDRVEKDLEDRFHRRLTQHVANADENILKRVDDVAAGVLRRANRRGLLRAAIIVPLILLLGALSHWRMLSEIVEPPPQTLVLDPALGWQSAGPVRAADKLCVRADGRIHLGLNQVVNVMNVAKPLIAEFARDGSATKLIASFYPRPANGGDVIFRRPFTDANGSDAPDPLLDDGKLKPECPWGQLLAVVLPKAVPRMSSQDPLAVVHLARLSLMDIACVGAQQTMDVPRDGVLAFIINDAVNSRSFERSRSSEMLDALEAAADELPKRTNDRQKLDKPSLPLFWYADNGGQLAVQISKGPCR